MKYDAICFDIDGTLYPMDLLNKLAKGAIMRHPFVSLKYRKMRDELRRVQDNDTELDKLCFREKEAEIYKRITNCKSREKAREKLDRTYYRGLETEYRKLGPMKDAAETFKKIKAAGIKIGVFSDWPLFSKLDNMGLKNLCDVISNSDVGGYLKPSVHAFDHMLYNLNVKPQKILYVGDSYEKDVLGAVACKMDAVLVNPECKRNPAEFPKALKVLGSWKEFDEFIDSLLEDK